LKIAAQKLTMPNDLAFPAKLPEARQKMTKILALKILTAVSPFQ
jgi:hypothetical protein